MASIEIVLCHPVRTTIGTHGGSLIRRPVPCSLPDCSIPCGATACGAVTLCIGGGQGIALSLEAL